MPESVVPEGWSYDPAYNFDGSGAWWHDDCPTPTILPDGSPMGGIAFEERSASRLLVAVVCGDCDDCISVSKRPIPATPTPEPGDE